MRDFAEHFYKSKAWQKNRDAYAKSVHGLCQDCLEKGQLTPGVIVHHLRPLTPENINDPAITMAWSNLRLVCRDHHKLYHLLRANRRYSVDESGRIVLRDVPPVPDFQESPGRPVCGGRFSSRTQEGGCPDGQGKKRDPDQGG